MKIWTPQLLALVYLAWLKCLPNLPKETLGSPRFDVEVAYCYVIGSEWLNLTEIMRQVVWYGFGFYAELKTSSHAFPSREQHHDEDTQLHLLWSGLALEQALPTQGQIAGQGENVP